MSPSSHPPLQATLPFKPPELKALRRLLTKLRAELPQLRICLSGDGLYACEEGFQVAKDYKCDSMEMENGTGVVILCKLSPVA
jgi:hypothetical protein